MNAERASPDISPDFHDSLEGNPGRRPPPPPEARVTTITTATMKTDTLLFTHSSNHGLDRNPA